jgi:hypothetical protein
MASIIEPYQRIGLMITVKRLKYSRNIKTLNEHVAYRECQLLAINMPSRNQLAALFCIRTAWPVLLR